MNYLEHIHIVQTYLFGGVKFLDLLVLSMAVDICTGIMRAAKEKKLRSRTAYFGYLKKVGVFGVIIFANIVDVILNLNGYLALVSVIFYIGQEGLSILENLTVLNVKIPKMLTNRLQIMIEENEKENTKKEQVK
ncbi:phage holin family protein [Fictibacillus enclensis]|uniref:phage holin family protein n=1 Tax=Fictibacillus enclensis TaxID=1017270 RepID=UPI0025A104A8|nr:phage holin family protein [Fictibacillus enclensis]MDM5199262.1 phage holin family protein [Fictibacillus enclensis]